MIFFIKIDTNMMNQYYNCRRTGYLEEQARLILHAQDSMASRNEKVSAFALALEVSELARDLKKVFEDVSHTGNDYQFLVKIYIYILNNI